ncbi:hypothetical protein SAMN04488109_1831 [Chryseolinea serpens]|uniref:Uncharacterized protein n=1 Tax=Chryseolinea serpens TaxID=947013 RepID=A0A1M5MMN7_9BACT|nr:hypothetical protein SAMN04488109_1831 [Chryseolinea serpens]
MKNISIKTTLKYIFEQLTGNFAGFLTGASTISLVSHFFVTCSFKTLGGLPAKKTVVNKETFQELGWVISIIIGSRHSK